MYLLHKVQNDDIDLLKRWLQQDYVAQWFGDIDDWMIEIQERDGKYSFIKHFIVEVLSNTMITIKFLWKMGKYSSRLGLMGLII